MSDAERIAALRGLDLPWHQPGFEDDLGRVVDLSDFAWGLIQRHPQWLGQELHALTGEDLPGHEADLADLRDLDESAYMAALRRYRHRQLLLITWRDITGRDEVDQTLARLSALADALMSAAFQRAGDALAQAHGHPRDADRNIQDLTVLALGKLGGGELNFSSDIDLVVAYPEAGSTDGDHPLDNQEFYARQVRKAVSYLADRTADGFVYRVDLRLRPFGDAGRLALSFAAMEEYFQREGRDWERYAWIKARPAAGDRAAGERLIETLRPFVYRRYLDYSAFDALREMKAMVRAEVERRGLEDDIKLGAGGIREIEFITQAFQLIRGGREPALRDRRLLPVLGELGCLGLLTASQSESLAAAYRFLRRLENRLQQVADTQTHRLPREPGLRQRVARSLGYVDWAGLMQQLDAHRGLVTRLFAELLEDVARGRGETATWAQVWDRAADATELTESLQGLGFADPAARAERLAAFRNSVGFRSLGERARSRLDRFMPHLLAGVAEHADPDASFEAVLPLVRAVASRSAYVALLSERPEVLTRLIDLCAASPWVAEVLTRHPLLLDELIDARLGQVRKPDELAKAADERLSRVDAGDLESEMETLRQVQQTQAMTIAVGCLDGRLSSAEVAQALTDLAECILARVLGLAWRDLTARHGQPSGPAPAFAVVGYGTLGGRELNFTSDLDLVFLHDGVDPSGSTHGDQPVGNERFLIRVTQRILHLLSTLTASGRLYEVDVRLRPNGNAGFLVTALDRFADYQREQAWTWERQALTRARVVAGDPGLKTALDRLRETLLASPVDDGQLATEVVQMRQRMREELDRSNADRFDLKQGQGGKIDIEFLAQWSRLSLAQRCPEILASTATVDAFRPAARAGLLSTDQANALVGAYELWQHLGQRLALAGRPEELGPEAHIEVRQGVAGIWRQVLG